jgi:hypothetical protein
MEWNEMNTSFYEQCTKVVGKSKCLIVHYERLVLNLERTMRRVTDFLGVTWTNDFLSHQRFVGSRIKVSEMEWSTPQIKRPVYLDSLNSWRNVTSYKSIYFEVKGSMYKKFGYNLKVDNYDYLKDL